jgi:hypothetical protein
VLIASYGIIARIIVKKWTHHEFGLGQGILGMKSGKRTILQEMLNLLFFYDARQASIFWFFPVKYAIKTRKSIK